LKPERRNIQATLRQVRELLHKQEIIESLVSRQHAHRKDLVESLVARQHEVELSQKFRHLHPADIAFVLESLPREQRLRLWRLVPSELDGAVLLETADAVREFLIADARRREDAPGGRWFPRNAKRSRAAWLTVGRCVALPPRWGERHPPSAVRSAVMAVESITGPTTPIGPPGIGHVALRRLAEKKARDHAGFSFVFKARRQAHSRTM
jgi:hypothetical protein